MNRRSLLAAFSAAPLATIDQTAPAGPWTIRYVDHETEAVLHEERVPATNFREVNDTFFIKGELYWAKGGAVFGAEPWVFIRYCHQVVPPKERA